MEMYIANEDGMHWQCVSLHRFITNLNDSSQSRAGLFVVIYNLFYQLDDYITIGNLETKPPNANTSNSLP